MIPTGSKPVAEVLIGREVEVAGGWDFEVAIQRSGIRSTHHVRLAWVDYEYWSHGAAAPERVLKALLDVLLEIAPDQSLPEQFDAATVRRWARGAAIDDRVKDRLG